MGAGGALEKDAGAGPGGQRCARPFVRCASAPSAAAEERHPACFVPSAAILAEESSPRGQRVLEVSRANMGAGLGFGNVQPGTRDSALAPGGRLTPRPPSILAGGFINVCFLSANEFNAECSAPSGSAGCAPCSERPSPDRCGPRRRLAGSQPRVHAPPALSPTIAPAASQARRPSGRYWLLGSLGVPRAGRLGLKGRPMETKALCPLCHCPTPAAIIAAPSLKPRELPSCIPGLSAGVLEKKKKKEKKLPIYPSVI